MKVSKKVSMMVMAIALWMGATMSVWASPNHDVVVALQSSKVPDIFVIQAENYLKTRILTQNEANVIISHINHAKSIAGDISMENLKSLSKAKQAAIISDIQAAAAVLDLKVSITQDANGKYQIVVMDANNDVVAVASPHQVKQTGEDYSLFVYGAIVLFLAGSFGVVASRKLAK